MVVWGALTDHPFSALGAALLIEACHWIHWRWQFGRAGYTRAWVLSLFALTGAVGYHSLNSTGPDALLNFLGLLPLIFLPLILAQQYGQEGAIPGTVFSLWARIQQKRNQKLGKVTTENLLHFGYPYFALTLVSTGYQATGLREQWSYFLVLILLTGAGIYYAHRRNQRRILPWLTVFFLTAGFSAAGSQGLLNFREWLKKRNFFELQGQDQSEEQITAIGKLGELKLDRRLQWRLQVADKVPVPDRLMTKAFNYYRQGKWRALDADFREYDLAFRELLRPVVDGNDGEYAFESDGFLADDQSETQLPPYQIRGAADRNRKPFPSPPSPQLFTEAEEVEAIEVSGLGTLLAINADAVVNLAIWGGENPSLREAPPQQLIRSDKLLDLTELDLPEPPARSDEAAVFRELADELALAQMTDEEKIDAIYLYFQENFTYTTHLQNNSDATSSAMVKFLTENRRGHCEYFATAAALLLRASGVPTRYVVGFAVQERSNIPGEYLLRGTHSHAWCRAYIGGTRTVVPESRTVIRNGGEETITLDREVWSGGKWVDVDVTPPDWLKLDSPAPSLRERVADTLQQWREDFWIWRSNSENRGWVNFTLGAVFISVLSFIGWRLSGSRLRHSTDSIRVGSGPVGSTTPLSAALPKLEKIFGRRPPGVPLSQWLFGEGLDVPLEGSSFSKENLARMLLLHEQSRFSASGPALPEAQELSALVSTFVRTCSQRKST